LISIYLYVALINQLIKTMKNESLKYAEKFFYEKFGVTTAKAHSYKYRFTPIEMCRFAAGFHENESNKSRSTCDKIFDQASKIDND